MSENIPYRIGGISTPERPGPLRDRIPYGMFNLPRFGFANRHQLTKWFGDESHGAFLAKNEYRVAKYNVPEDSVITTEHQAVFDKVAARLISRRRIKYPETFERLIASKQVKGRKHNEEHTGKVAKGWCRFGEP